MDELKNLRNLFQLNNLDYYLSLVETEPTNEAKNLPPPSEDSIRPRTKLDNLPSSFDTIPKERKLGNEAKGTKSFPMPDLDAVLTNSFKDVNCSSVSIAIHES
jgi:hypothetical protein